MVTLQERINKKAPYERMEEWADHFREEFVKRSPYHIECEMYDGGYEGQVPGARRRAGLQCDRARFYLYNAFDAVFT